MTTGFKAVKIAILSGSAPSPSVRPTSPRGRGSDDRAVPHHRPGSAANQPTWTEAACVVLYSRVGGRVCFRIAQFFVLLMKPLGS
jgi:hypothetical protein